MSAVVIPIASRLGVMAWILVATLQGGARLKPATFAGWWPASAGRRCGTQRCHPQRCRGGVRVVAMAEVRERLDAAPRQLGQLCRNRLQLVLRIQQLPVAHIRPPGCARDVADADCSGLGEPLVDAVPARIPEVEGVADARV